MNRFFCFSAIGYIAYFLFFTCVSIDAKVKLPEILSDNMVLQQQSLLKLWGKSKPNQNIKIAVPWLTETVNTFSDKNGNWMIRLRTPKAGGPYNIIFDDGDTLELRNVMIGEVWLCSGQSNMQMSVRAIRNSNDILSDSNSEVPIRMFTVHRKGSIKPLDDVSGSWCVNTSLNVADFSAVAYIFGKQLYNSLHVPIGLINSSYGGSLLESWMPLELVRMYENIDNDKMVGRVKTPNKCPSMLHNSMLYPLKNLCIKGIIWYQGEANRHNPSLYEKLFVSFIDYVRVLFNNKDLPFYYAQIAPYDYKTKDLSVGGAMLREAQLNCERKLMNSGMAVLMDIGEETLIHPTRKEEVGKRLSYFALKNQYGYDSMIPFSPRYKTKKVVGNRMIITFENVSTGLTSFGKELTTFEIASEDKKFFPAKAIIKGNKVELYSDSVEKPVAARYAFREYVQGELYSGNGLPVSSFRTDSW